MCCVGTLIARSIYKQSSELGFSCSVKRQKRHVNGRNLAVALNNKVTSNAGVLDQQIRYSRKAIPGESNWMNWYIRVGHLYDKKCNVAIFSGYESYECERRQKKKGARDQCRWWTEAKNDEVVIMAEHSHAPCTISCLPNWKRSNQLLIQNGL